MIAFWLTLCSPQTRLLQCASSLSVVGVILVGSGFTPNGKYDKGLAGGAGGQAHHRFGLLCTKYEGAPKIT